MPHMIAEEHMNYYIIDPALPRNQATINGALSAIGSTPTTLVLTYSGDGVWSLTSNLTSLVNVQIYLPPGVTVNIPTGVTWTIQGSIIAPYYAWQTGAGSVVRGLGGATEISTIRATQVHTIGNVNGVVVSDTAVNNYIALTADVGSNFVGIDLGRGPFAPPSGPNANGWRIAIDNTTPSALFLGRPGFPPNVAMTSVGTWLGNGGGYTVPTFLVQAQTNQCAMPGGGPWLSWSDERVKTVQRVYADGLAMLLALPEPVWYKYNGKGGAPNDDNEYIGMIAQDVQPTAPYMIGTYEAKLEETDPEPTELLTMNNGAMVYALVNAVRELAARVETLETTIASLTGIRLQGLESAAHTHGGSGNSGAVVAYQPPTSVEAAEADAPAAEPEPESHPHRRRRH